MSDINDLFGPDKKEPTPIGKLTRENACVRLPSIQCPRCGTTGHLDTFTRAMHVGVLCRACGREHVLRPHGVTWLPGDDNAWRRGQP